MTDLNTYFDSVSGQSKFPCSLGSLGGFVNFRNSGQRGSVKEFTLSLESILSGLKDIRSNLKEFSSMTRYVEKEWRDNGSKYFTDLILNSMITVQTKPCFTTFSKIINWATEKDFSDYDDNAIDLSSESLNVTIEKIENLALSFSPNEHAKKKRIINAVKPLEAQLLSKPFLLLAGISGTGKTRFVREQAKTSKQFAETYCLTSVRPDWHEPSDLLGYISRLAKDGEAEYITTDVLQFIAKAWRAIADNGLAIEVQESEDQGERLVVAGERDALDKVLPYWLCLDEMNLAPVEQYFADYLSVLETREWSWTGDSFTYSCDALLKPATIKEVADKEKLREALGFDDAQYDELWADICQYGLGIPFNLLVAGTVNMDETTHGFSRKVIDRALSFDFGAFFPNDYHDFFTPTSCNKRLSYPIWSNASKADLADTFDADGTKTVAFLSAVNAVLKNTPFELAFRALNELLLAVASSQPHDELTLKAVWDDFMMCKVLPRIEGDTDKLTTSDGKALLVELDTVLTAQLAPIWQAEQGDRNQRPDLYREKIVADDATDEEKVLRIPCRSKAKLKWMSERLVSATFTSFWP
ncbi:McrB family protein [Vibrio cholerae]|uniref:McrB family protein n=1 Tax=Vibrio cholerae TaxID=666 RepID=UPI001E4DA436|nr:restriction endonuclease [Vibrio cholerae]GHW59116.1 5-methylcytosine-specific restriction related enzyme [Vibrio cholerae]GHY58471.1 5-methylcytosine-specific restriction related enzyme [Vibrio cholerae]GHZ12967.1 5-methylcytosine-specific restriction related enzyme [Vibrio cholerae]GIA60814.1 5-methylcytosine-specific restriction related enzyme [Vibrio cholerae]